MKINIAKSAGFCFGVKRAVDIAFQIAQKSPQVYMLGDIVHNEEVVKQIKKAGIKKISSLGYGKGKILLLRAHGASAAARQTAETAGYRIMDATCPKVKEIHKIVRQMEQNGYRIIVIGDKKHEEVQGIVGQIKSKALVIDDIKNISGRSIKKIQKACCVVQSTQNLDRTLEIVERLKSFIKDLRFFNTICRTTVTRQTEIKKMPLENDVMIIIGSKKSANTKRLYEISKSLNKKTFWCQSKKDIRLPWFRKAQSVGVTAGASTPESTIAEIVEYLKKLP